MLSLRGPVRCREWLIGLQAVLVEPVPCVLSCGGTSGTKLELLDFIWNESGTRSKAHLLAVRCREWLIGPQGVPVELFPAFCPQAEQAEQAEQSGNCYILFGIKAAQERNVLCRVWCAAVAVLRPSGCSC